MRKDECDYEDAGAESIRKEDKGDQCIKKQVNYVTNREKGNSVVLFNELVMSFFEVFCE